MGTGYFRLLCLLLLANLMIANCTSSKTGLPHPCEQATLNDNEPLLLADANRRLQRYLEVQGLTAQIQAQEEGAFMLGAYPRSRVLWSIRVMKPALKADDDRAALDEIALAAYCLRPGWVWLNIASPAGQTRLISYPQADLEKLSVKVFNIP